MHAWPVSAAMAHSRYITRKLRKSAAISQRSHAQLCMMLHGCLHSGKVQAGQQGLQGQQRLNPLGTGSTSRPLRILIDSGCSHTFVSDRLTQFADVYQSSEQHSVCFVDGSTSQTASPCTIDLQLQTYREIVPALTTELSLDYDVILGDDWGLRTGLACLWVRRGAVIRDHAMNTPSQRFTLLNLDNLF